MLKFLERAYPSGNCVWLAGERPVLVDTGFGSDAAALLDALPGAPALVFNTHWHTDHSGGNHAVQRRFGVDVAASADEAGPVNRREANACEVAWLVQPIEQYSVGITLQDGGRLETGDSDWTVVATPGHTAGHLSLHCKAARAVVLGDALHHADIGWISPLRGEALAQSAATLERIAGLGATIGYPGHGPAITDMGAALDRGRRRVEAWRRDPEAAGWHACKRIFAHALMLADGIGEAEIAPTLLALPWFGDHAQLVFRCAPAELVAPLLREMLRSDAAYWRDGVLKARAAYQAPAAGWLRSPGSPAGWVTPPLPA